MKNTVEKSPARNGSIPPITLTDRSGQERTMFHTNVGGIWKSFQAMVSIYLRYFQSLRVTDYSIFRQSP